MTPEDQRPEAQREVAPPYAPQSYRRLARVVDVGTEWVVGLVANVLVVLMAVALLVSAVVLAYRLAATVDEGTLAEIKELVLGVLTVFIIIEIFDLFREFVRTERIRMLNLAEVSIAVVLRELWLKLLEGAQDWLILVGISVALAATTALWVLAGGPGVRLAPLRRRAAGGDGDDG